MVHAIEEYSITYRIDMGQITSGRRRRRCRCCGGGSGSSSRGGGGRFQCC